MTTTDTTNQTTIDNGVNVEALLGAREAMTGMPAAAAFTFSAQSEWVNGTHASTTVEKFFGIGEEQTHRRAFVLDTDHPQVFASEDHGISPPEMVLVSLVGCLTAGIASVAQNRGIQLRSVKATFDGRCTEVQRVVVYEATSADGSPPSATQLSTMAWALRLGAASGAFDWPHPASAAMAAASAALVDAFVMASVPSRSRCVVARRPGDRDGQARPGAARVSADLPAAFSSGAPLNASASEHWRIQRGLPAAPSELNDDTNPFELGLADRVSLSKGCYVGQETLAKLATYDGVKQLLRRWCWTPPDGAPPPEPGQVLVAAEAPGGGRLGTVTSVHRLADGRWIGLALVRRQALDAAELQLGPDPGGPRLQLSIPPAFVAPPVGAGAQASP